MKRTMSLSVAVIFSFFSQFNSAGTLWEEAIIQKISSNKYGEVQIKLDKSASTTCDNKRILLVPNENGRVGGLLSKAMFAYTTGEKIYIYGSGECDGEFEVLRSIVKL